MGRQSSQGGLNIINRVEKERATTLQALQHIVLLDIRGHMASHEVGSSNQVGRSDGVITETKVRRGVTTRLLRVV